MKSILRPIFTYAFLFITLGCALSTKNSRREDIDSPTKSYMAKFEDSLPCYVEEQTDNQTCKKYSDKEILKQMIKTLKSPPYNQTNYLPYKFSCARSEISVDASFSLHPYLGGDSLRMYFDCKTGEVEILSELGIE